MSDLRFHETIFNHSSACSSVPTLKKYALSELLANRSTCYCYELSDILLRLSPSLRAPLSVFLRPLHAFLIQYLSHHPSRLAKETSPPSRSHVLKQPNPPSQAHLSQMNLSKSSKTSDFISVMWKC